MEQFGPCRVVRKLGEGGMGAVYLPQDDRLHRHVALKILPEYLAQDRSRRVRFEREARAAAMLVHPNICVDLPFIDGHKVLEALREKGIDVPTIFVSGLPGEEPEVRAFAIGAADFHPQAREELGAAGQHLQGAAPGPARPGGGRCFAFADTRQSTTDHAVDRPRPAHNRSLWCMLRSPTPEALHDGMFEGGQGRGLSTS